MPAEGRQHLKTVAADLDPNQGGARARRTIIATGTAGQGPMPSATRRR